MDHTPHDEARWGSRPLASLTYRDVDEYKAWRKAQPRRRRGKGLRSTAYG
jgi:hypothetical protein